jgi:hypothetical protein
MASQDDQQVEISSLRDYFKDNIRILSSIGQFSYILKIQAHQYDVSLTLQLDGKLRQTCAILFDLFFSSSILSFETT